MAGAEKAWNMRSGVMGSVDAEAVTPSPRGTAVSRAIFASADKCRGVYLSMLTGRGGV